MERLGASSDLANIEEESSASFFVSSFKVGKYRTLSLDALNRLGKTYSAC